MRTVVLRFLGRFVCAEQHRGGIPAGVLDVLATDMQFNPEIRSGRHQFALSIPRASVVQPGSRPPDLMIGSQDEPDLAEHGIWLLHNHDVMLTGEKTFRWATRRDPTLIDLAVLSPEAKLDPAAVYARGAVIGRVHLPLGTGAAQQIIPGKTVKFVRLSEQGIDRGDDPLPIADLVVVTIDLADDATSLAVFMKSRAGGPTGAVVVKVVNDEPTILTFTNLCPLPHSEVDEEFAGLYDVLQNPPLTVVRLVPKEQVPRLGHLDDCYNQAYIAYEI